MSARRQDLLHADVQPRLTKATRQTPCRDALTDHESRSLRVRLQMRFERGLGANVSRPVSRVLYRRASVGDDHSSGAHIAGRLMQPTRTLPLERSWSCSRKTWRPYSVLLLMGFAVPSPLPDARWALTPPFHPSRHAPGASEVCFLLHCPWGRPRRALPGIILPWSPDFPPAQDRTGSHPTD